MTYARRIARRAGLRRTRRSLNRGLIRRTLRAESLEARSLLAADLGFHSQYWNQDAPTDVTDDGHVAPLDALVIINSLNRDGSRRLPALVPGEGESAEQLRPAAYYDVSNDGHISPLDLLLVFNDLNAEGENDGNDQAGYQIRIVAPGAPLFKPHDTIVGSTQPTDDLTTVSIGESYDIVVTVIDYRPGQGVFAGALDIGYESDLARVQVSEIQRLHIGPFDPATSSPAGDKVTGTTGTFTISVPFATGTETTAAINYSGAEQTLINNVTNALNALPSIDNDPDGLGPLLGGVAITPIRFDTTQIQFDIRFLGSLYDKDVPNMTIASQNLTRGPTATLPTPTVSMTYEGDLQGGATPYAFAEAFRSRGIPTITNVSTGRPPGGYFPNSVKGGDGFPIFGPDGPDADTDPDVIGTNPDGLNDVGGVGDNSDPKSGALTLAEIAAGYDTPPARELVRARMIATAEGTLVFTPSIINVVRPTGDTLLYDLDVAVPDENVDIGVAVTLNVSAGPFNAVPDVITDIVEDTPRLIDVLANDTTTPTGGVKHVTAVTQPTSGGSVTFTTAGVTFTPAADFNFNTGGVVSFTYTAKNNTLDADGSESRTALVTVTVNAVNDPPTVTNPGTQFVNEGGGTVVVNLTTAPGPVTATDEAGQTVSVTAQSSANGVVTASLTGNTLTLTGGTAGTAVVTLVATDTGTPAASATVTFSVTVAAVNDPPVLTVPGPQTTDIDVPLVLSTANSNAISVADPDAGTANITVSVTSSNGAVSVPAGGIADSNPSPTIVTLVGSQAAINTKLAGGLTYTPPGAFDGAATLTVVANDGNNTGTGGAQTATATIGITVKPAAPRPIADPDTFTTQEDNPPVFTVAAPGVLDGDTEAPGQNRGPLTTVPATTTVSGGVVVLRNDGSFDLTLTPNFNGVTSFTYRAQAGDGTQSLPAVVTITVTSVNDVPDAVADALDAVKDQTTRLDVLTNDTDADSDVLTITAVGATALPGSTVTIEAGGRAVLYTPPTGVTSPPLDSFTYTISDGNGGTDTATVTVNIRDFVPKTLSGKVYIDVNNNGVADPNEKGIAGVTVTLTGTGINGPIAPRTAETDSNGNYSFAGVSPGTYAIVETQPVFMLDGLDTETSTLASVSANDTFSLTWGPEDRSGDIVALNFGERGINVAHPEFINTAGLLAEQFASSSSNGYVLMTTVAGETIWGWKLDNWGEYDVQVFINTNDWSSIRVVVSGPGLTGGSREITVYQDPRNNPAPLASHSHGPRFRVLAIGTNGRYMIRLDGTAADFGIGATQTAFAPVPQAEGEGMSDREFSEAADAVFDERSWA